MPDSGPNRSMAQSTEPTQPESSNEHSQKDWQHDSSNPINWSGSKKWRITLLAAAVTLLVGLNATAVTTPGQAIVHTFRVDDSGFPNSFWPVTVWNTGAALGPLIGIPLLENFGTRSGYLICYFGFAIFVIPQAIASNFATLLVCRAIAGALGGVLQNAMEVFVADIWQIDRERNLPVTLYILVLLAGVTLGPALGAIVSTLSWRWVFYVQIVIYWSFFPILAIFFDETRGSVALSKHARKDVELKPTANELSEPSISVLLRDAIIRPANMLCTEPVVFFLTLWSAFSFGLVFISTQSVEQVYSANYEFSGSATGLAQTAIFVGEIIGLLACLPQNEYYQRSARRNPVEVGVPIPEARLPLSIPASLFGLAGGLFWYGWSSLPHVHWIVPTVGLAFVGFGIMIIVTSVGMYITDFYVTYAGSAIAAVAFGENIFAAWLPLATRPMYDHLGFQWASSLLGFVAVALTLAPVCLLFKGSSIRERSKFVGRSSYK